jgi:3-oxoacyl-[acyl-carrier-protein] synthase-1
LGGITLFPTRHDLPVSEVKAGNGALAERLSLSASRTFSRTSLLGMLAAKEASGDAAIPDGSGVRIGLVSATSTGGMDLTERFYPLFREHPAHGRLRYAARHDAGDSTERIAAYLGITGFRTTVSTACSSAANAIMFAARLIRNGILDAALAGGTDALCRFTLNGFASLMILDKAPCRPFDDTRAGLNLGEGAGYLVLQSEAALTKPPYCELAGYANVNDAYHQTASSPNGAGAYRSMKACLEKAGVLPHEVDYINAHGTGTVNNDASESAAIRRLFAGGVPPFSSTKAFTGHTLGAAGGLEAVFSVLALSGGLLFPNKNFTTPAPPAGLIPVTRYAEGASIRTVLSNSFGFGGNDTSLLFRKTDRQP